MDGPTAEKPPDAFLPHEDLVLELARSRDDLTVATTALLRSETMREAAAVREAALRAELQHRVRNMLATIRSVFDRTMDTADTLQEAADHFKGRLNALARYQGLLAGRSNGGVDLEMLVRDELLTMGFGDCDRITIEGAAVTLPIKTAQVIGLAVHELATNAMKFGALSVEDGRLTVLWKIESSLSELSIVWTESGVPILAGAPRKLGFGNEYIQSALPYELDARTSLELRPGGLLCSIDLPTRHCSDENS